jgi:hypothetical protein
MTVQFNNIFAGERPRRRKIQRQAFIDKLFAAVYYGVLSLIRRAKVWMV